MNQEEIRYYLGTNERVRVQVSAPGDGSPEIAWGDTFFSVIDKDGESKKMPFATIVVKDYDDFDCDSQLNRGGLYRLNIEVGKEKFEELFGFKPKEFEFNRKDFDFTSIDKLFPHPIYGAQGWVSIINPSDNSKGEVISLLESSRDRVLSRAAA